MARIDQDNFSNVSWHSEGPGASSSSGAPIHDAPVSEHTNGREHIEPQPNLSHLDAGAAGTEILDCVVSTPITENEGTSTNFVSYLITTNVCEHYLPGLGRPVGRPPN